MGAMNHMGRTAGTDFYEVTWKALLKDPSMVGFMYVTAQCFAKCFLLEPHNFKQNAVIFDSKTL